MRTIGSILIAFTIVACGGGGGGDGGPTAPNNPGPGPNPGGPSSSSASVVMQKQGDEYGTTTWSFNPSTVTITRGGTVTWTNGLNEQHDVVFAGVAGAPANVPAHTSGSNSRTFSSTGTFNYQCSFHPMSGQVVVP